MKTIITCLICLLSVLLYGQDEIMINGQPCGMHGSSQSGTPEYDLNPLKNRYNLPTNADIDRTITLQNLVARTSTSNAFKVSQAVDITGYVLDVKVGGIESCNCHSKTPDLRDTHIEITLSPSNTGPGDRFIAEITPRMRQMMKNQGIDWSTQALEKTIKGKMVRIRGWLFYDAEHEQQSFANDPDDNIGIKNWRATCWEVHPITFLEIQK
jgi:hypothetical protein